MNDKTNPANESKVSEVPKGYIPMSAPTQRLQVPEKAGFHRHWFRGDPARIQRAKQAGYDFVDPKDVAVNNFDLGGDASNSGNTDMGTRVSIASGEGPDAGRLYLMEVPDHLYEYSQKLLADRNDSVAAALRAGLVGADNDSPEDRANRYMKGNVPDLFNPNKRRR